MCSGKHISDTLALCATCLFLPHFDVIGDLLLNRRTATCMESICQADDRKRSQSRLLHTFRSAEVSKLQARCAGRKITANNMAEVEEEILPQANLFFHLVLKRRHASFIKILKFPGRCISHRSRMYHFQRFR